MFLILGLGNPGQKYQKTRHNIGFMVADELKKRGEFPDFKFSKRSGAELSSGFFQGEKIMLAKPQTFMNNSGRAAKAIIANLILRHRSGLMVNRVEPLKFPPAGRAGKVENFWVIHDDIDLILGKIKIVKGRGAAGHKGVDSIIKELKTNDFVRFRVGIKTGETKDKKQEIEKFVLKKFNKKEEGILKEVIEKTCLAIEMNLKEGLEKTMNEFNK